MSRDRGYWWVPGNARSDRGYTLAEARAAVGPGWRSLAEQAWLGVTESYPQAEVAQVKQKFGALRVYWRVPPEHEEPVASLIYQLEERSRSTCEWCGGAGAGGECAECAANPHPPGLELHGRETEALRQWISSEPRRNRPEWMRPLLLEPGAPDWDLIHDSVRRVGRS